MTISVEAKGCAAGSMTLPARSVFLRWVGEILFGVCSALSAKLPATGDSPTDKSAPSRRPRSRGDCVDFEVDTQPMVDSQRLLTLTVNRRHRRRDDASLDVRAIRDAGSQHWIACGVGCRCRG